jgi:hypothetical protein
MVLLTLLDTVRDVVGVVRGILGGITGVVAGVLGGVTDIARLAQDKNNTPWGDVGTGVKASKNITDKIALLGNIIHVTDFRFRVT